jgi:hypothetical protein
MNSFREGLSVLDDRSFANGNKFVCINNGLDILMERGDEMHN